MKFLKQLIIKIFHIQDSPDSEYGREWRRWISVSKKHLSISYEIQLIRWKGVEQAPKPVSMIGAFFKLNPKEWTISSDHTYYDGQNCSWQFGPIGFYRSGGFGHCDKCYDNT